MEATVQLCTKSSSASMASVMSSMSTMLSTMDTVITSFLMPYATGSSLNDSPHVSPGCVYSLILFHTISRSVSASQGLTSSTSRDFSAGFSDFFLPSFASLSSFSLRAASMRACLAAVAAASAAFSPSSLSSSSSSPPNMSSKSSVAAFLAVAGALVPPVTPEMQERPVSATTWAAHLYALGKASAEGMPAREVSWAVSSLERAYPVI
mmetsp:Transcript_9803/g.21988  ORF Transcript_9803/g.21988 Transcript_9803/m.21988 type:complete len:208 (-) Transcript_9803:109-732(-)